MVYVVYGHNPNSHSSNIAHKYEINIHIIITPGISNCCSLNGFYAKEFTVEKSGTVNHSAIYSPIVGDEKLLVKQTGMAAAASLRSITGSSTPSSSGPISSLPFALSPASSTFSPITGAVDDSPIPLSLLS